MVLGKLTVWWMTIRALLLALANAVSTGRLVLPPTLPKVRGYFEVAVEVAVFEDETPVRRVFEATEANYSEAADMFCHDFIAAGPDVDECERALKQRARDVLLRCLTLIHIPSPSRTEACRWVADDDEHGSSSGGDGTPTADGRPRSLVEVVDGFADHGRRAGFEKYRHYWAIFEQHLARFRGRRFRMLEIGVAGGGSAEVWREWLGGAFELHALEICPSARRFARARNATEGGTVVHIGDQADRGFVREVLRNATGGEGFDVVLDDGGHFWAQQRASFDELFPSLRARGVYIVEDTHTSYWPHFGGGGGGGDDDDAASFLGGFLRARVDAMHAFHLPDGSAARARLAPADWAFARQARSISVYESVVVIEKHARPIGVIDLAPTIRGEFLAADGETYARRKMISSFWPEGGRTRPREDAAPWLCFEAETSPANSTC